MSKGSFKRRTQLRPNSIWRVPYGSNTPEEVHNREWNGTDGRHRQNAYKMTSYRHSDGWLFGNTYRADRTCSPTAMYWLTSSSVWPWMNIRHQTNVLPSAIANLVETIQNHSWNPLVTMGEGKKTLKYLGDTLGRIARSLAYLKKRDGTRALRALGINVGRKRLRSSKDWKRFWLEYNYAILPLMFDATSAFEFLNRATPRQSARLRGRARVERTDYKPPSTPELWDIRCHTGCEVRITLTEDFDPNSVIFLNPYELVWELTPFSFIIDWIIPIGDYLRARHFFNFFKGFKDGSYTYLSRLSGTYDPSPWIGNSNFCSNRFLKIGKIEHVCVDRVPWNGYVPIPTRITNPFARTSDWKRVVTAAALIGARSESLLNKNHLLK